MRGMPVPSVVIRLLVIALCLIVLPLRAAGVEKNGFDLTDATVPHRDILRGGPARDGIFALTKPDFDSAEETQIGDDEKVLAVIYKGVAKAYPLRMLTIHEIVNDVIEDQFYAITYCPLCGSGVAFAANIGSGHLNFGVSGLLYNSDMLLYDRNTESLWSQLAGSAIAGRLKGTELPRMPVWHTTWRGWLDSHPTSLVMRGDPNFKDAYKRDPYPGYTKTRRLLFRVDNKAPRTYHPKEKVMGVTVGDVAKAYPFVELNRQGLAQFNDTVGGSEIIIRWDASNESASASTTDNATLVTTTLYWFAWFAFNSETQVFAAVSAK